MRKTIIVRFLVAGSALALAASGAHAAIIVDLVSVTPLGGGLYQWSYSADLQPDANMRVTATPPPGPGLLPHDAFTLYDVAGLVAGSAVFTPYVSNAFLTTVSLFGLNPPMVMPVDTALPNISVELVGWGDISPVLSGPAVNLGTLSFTSTFSIDSADYTNFAAQTQKKSNRTTLSNIGFVLAPVPEPTAMLLPGAALLGLGLRRRK